jgi:hypothetical protein
VADRDALGLRLEAARVDPVRALAEELADLARQQLLDSVVRERGQGADGLDPGNANGARNSASRPGRTTTRPPGFRVSLAILATTLAVATPSEQVRLVAPRTAV